MILSERNVEAGAYFVDFEHFQIIYRLLARMVDNYNKGLQLMQFTVKDEKFADKFKEILVHSLRKSDCITQSGKVTFLVLLMEATASESEIVKDRIMGNVKKQIDFDVDFENEQIF